MTRRLFVMYDGYVFFCTKTSQQACLSNGRYACADEKTKPDKKIKEGSVIFLYNTDEKTLLGPFTALTEGAEELDSGAWAEDVDTHIPSEDIKVNWESLHVVRDAPTQLPFLKDMKTCRLTTLQTQRALDVLKGGELYIEEKDHVES
jgi:hypothetical protein